MAKISFYLTNPKAKNKTSLFCLINYGLYRIENESKKYLPLKYYTDISILPNLWNKKLNRGIEPKGEGSYIKWASPETFDINANAVEESAKKNYESFNTEIEKFDRTAKDLVNALTVNGNIPSHEKIRAELDKIYKPSKVAQVQGETPRELFDFIDHLIKTTNNKQSTVKSYKVVRKNLQDYQTAKKTKLNFENIDIDFYNSFVDYLTKPTKGKTKAGLPITKAGLSKNTIGTRIKVLKVFLSQASERGIPVCSDYLKKSFRKPSEETSSIYLNEAEIDKMYYIETAPESIERLTKKYNTNALPLYLEKVRDLFIIGCNTGLRFSDLSKLNNDNIKADGMIEIKTQKTEKKVIVPINPTVRAILDKYKNQLPRAISNQKFNEYLKEIAELAGIDEPITTEITKGGFKVIKTTEKYNLVTSHTARRSFATNAFLADVPSISIMKITGHKTESAFMKYIKMSAKDNAIKMQSHRFFTKLQVAK